MDYNSTEGKHLLKNPLMKIKGKKDDFIKALFFKAVYKKARRAQHKQKVKINKLEKKIKALETQPRTDFEELQQQQIEKLWRENKQLKKELIDFKNKYN